MSQSKISAESLTLTELNDAHWTAFEDAAVGFFGIKKCKLPVLMSERELKYAPEILLLKDPSGFEVKTTDSEAVVASKFDALQAIYKYMLQLPA